MSNYDYKSYYRRNLPHLQPPNTPLFVTFRLVGSLPKDVLARLAFQTAEDERSRTAILDKVERARAEYLDHKRAFARWDRVLDEAVNGPRWLEHPQMADLAAKALHYRHPDTYVLDAFCIMPTHVHAVIAPADHTEGQPVPLQTVMHSLKRYTAREANRVLKREGQFWHHETYDHYIRDADEWERVIHYVRNNPVKAGMVANWEEWPWTYVRRG